MFGHPYIKNVESVIIFEITFIFICYKVIQLSLSTHRIHNVWFSVNWTSLIYSWSIKIHSCVFTFVEWLITKISFLTESILTWLVHDGTQLPVDFCQGNLRIKKLKINIFCCDFKIRFHFYFGFSSDRKTDSKINRH